MKKVLKHIWVVLMLLVCVFTFRTNAYAQGTTVESGQYGENVFWVLDSDGVMTFSGTGAMWDAVGDHEMYDYHPCPWTDYRDSIKKVVFSDGITYVGAGAFWGCENLETIIFTDTITYIGNFAFYYCEKLGNVDLPQNLEIIGQAAFSGAKNMTRFIIPDSVIFIDGEICAFNINLKYVYIGGNADVPSYTIGGAPFRFCTSLEAIEVSDDNIGLKSIDGVLYLKNGETLIQYPLGKKDETCTIDIATKQILQMAFEGAYYLENIVLPEGLKQIDICAFSEMKKLTSLTIPSTVEFIGAEIVRLCPKIQWVCNNSNAEVTFGDETWYDENGNQISSIKKGTAYKPAGKTGLFYDDVAGLWVYYTDGIIDCSYIGLAQGDDGNWYYVENGTVNFSYTDLVSYNGGWFYVEEGCLNWNYTGLVQYAGAWFYVENSVLNWSYTGLTLYNGVWFYVEGGVLNWNYTGLTPYGDAWFYVEGGQLNWGYTGLVQHYGAWFYVEGGQLNWGYTGLVQYYDAWFYVEGGMLNWNYTGLVQYNGVWFYVQGGQLHWGYTGLVEHYGAWFYVEGGMLNWNYTGLVQYYDAWFYVNSGQLDWSYTGLCEYNGILFYIQNGQLNWGYTGTVEYNGVIWYVENGIAIRVA